MGDYTKFNASISMDETGEITLVANRLLPENKNWYVQCSITISGKEFTLDTLYDFEQIDDYTYRTYGNGEYFAAFAGKQVSVLAIAFDADTGWEYEAKTKLNISPDIAPEEPLVEITQINYDPVTQTISGMLSNGEPLDNGELLLSFSDNFGASSQGTYYEDSISNNISMSIDWCNRYGKKYNGASFWFRAYNGEAYGLGQAIYIYPDGSWKNLGTGVSVPAGKEEDTTPPELVTGLAVPLVDSKYKVTLSWDPAVDNSGKIASYEIQLDDGKILKSSKTSITVSKLSIGEHFYKVRAIDKAKNAGEWSDLQYFTVNDMTAPTSVKAKATVDGYSVLFTLSGKDNSGSIARYVVTCGDKSVETTTDTAVLSDFGVGKQTAFVIAYDAEGNASKEAKVSFNVKDATPPEQVTGLAIPLVDSKYKATLSWDPAVDNSGKIASYEIQLDDGKILKSSKTSVNVSKLSVGEHSYKVRAIDKDKNVGEWSDSQSFYVQDMTAPGNVSAKASVEENSLLLSWKTPKDNVGVTGYILKHGVNLENEEFLAAEELNYRIDGIAKGTYQYQITAVDDAGNMSKPKTGKVTIKTELPVEEPVLPEPASLNVFDSGAELALASIDDPLAIASNLKLDAEETLSVAELTGQDTTNSNRLQLFTVAS